MSILRNLTLASFLASSLLASEFISYDNLTKNLKLEAKQDGTLATTSEVLEALASKEWAVVDIRTKEEWAAASINGSVYIGREAAEKNLEAIVLDESHNFIKRKLIVVCNTASRAVIDAQIFRQMGFEEVKSYGITQWIDECNPVNTMYSNVSSLETNSKFGSYYAEHCKQ